ncbi:MAG: galactokinase, partial [SAR324 cluster bacterium]|nr:galactokinase [SAR324 cluster bacterium]
ARHVIKENERVLDCAESLLLENLDHVGELINASHISLRDDFEVSSEALDLMVDYALTAPGCYGARMTGAGFGGCAVALVESKYTDKFVKKVLNSYQTSTGKKALLYVCKATEGTSVFSNDEFTAN